MTVFTGWKNITLGDLLIAYRKAKADNHFENNFPTAIKFAEYEQDLLENLNKLLESLRNEEKWYSKKEFVGECRLLPKKLNLNPKEQKLRGHIFFSEPINAFNNLKNNNSLHPEFRIVGDFSVNAHIVSALWINSIGHKFDACLNDQCYGARLKRIKNDDVLGKFAKKTYHLSAIGSFEPYYKPYQNWRRDGLTAIRDELDKGKPVIAASLDLKSYYHLIDPSFISSKFFHEEIGLIDENELTKEEQIFTNQVAYLLKNWSVKANKFAQKFTKEEHCRVNGGLVIGLTVSRILSNVLLYKWDQLIRERVTPIHYGRYIDDMFLVISDPGTLYDTETFMRFLGEKLSDNIFCDIKAEDEEEIREWSINLGGNYQQETKIHLQKQKQKLFILSGQAGYDLLDSIEKEIHELSSEHRLMPSPDQLEHTTAMRVLSAAGSVGEEPDTFRKADGLTIRRLSWAIQLRHVETLANDLPKNAWVENRNEFYEFARNHILRPDKIFEHFVYLPRLLGFAIRLEEWNKAEEIVNRSFNALEELSESFNQVSCVSINGTKCDADKGLWKHINCALAWFYIEAAAKYYTPEKLLTEELSEKERRLADIFLNQILNSIGEFKEIFELPMDLEEFYSKAPLLALCDLAKTPYKEILRSEAANYLHKKRDANLERGLLKEMGKSGIIKVSDLKDFLTSTKQERLKRLKGTKQGEFYKPLLFPTRPYTPPEISELAPECVGLGKASKELPQSIWARYVRALRGVWVKPVSSESSKINQPSSKYLKFQKRVIQIGLDREDEVYVAITNIKTTEKEWAASASGKPRLTTERYSRISDLVNRAIKLNPKPDYLIFPELSIPKKWVTSIGNRLTSAGISLIAGTEYRYGVKNTIYSEAYLELKDNRLGFASSSRIWQPKLEPAVDEGEKLDAIHGKKWKKFPGLNKPVYNHNNFHFGVMICSELQNSKERISFQGEVDSLMVLAWNRDLETFSTLVEATALDVHAYTILVNNRVYGDSRVRVPRKAAFLRDLARIRGGENDYCVTVKLNIKELREFQSRAKRISRNDDPFKIVPEGYKISSSRRTLPAK